MFEENKIKDLLKAYGMGEEEIEKFINDLKKDIKEKVEDKIEEFDKTNDNDFIID